MKSVYIISVLLLIVMIASMIALQMKRSTPPISLQTQKNSPPRVRYFSTDSQSSPRPSLVSVPKQYDDVHSHPINIIVTTPPSPQIYETFEVNPMPPMPVPYTPPSSHRPNPPPPPQIYETFAVNPMPPMPVPYTPPSSHRPNPPPSLTPSLRTQKFLLNEMYKQ